MPAGTSTSHQMRPSHRLPAVAAGAAGRHSGHQEEGSVELIGQPGAGGPGGSFLPASGPDETQRDENLRSTEPAFPPDQAGLTISHET